MTPVQKSQHIFTQKYNKQPELIVYAPGRVNIIGEHTDYNDGFVMPCAINYGTAIAGSKRADHIWNVYAADLDLEDTFSLDEDFPQSEQKWANYVRGVVKFIQERCPQFKQGADLVISGNVPHSSGLSSSAALEVATGKFCQQLSDLPLTHTEIALIGQKAVSFFKNYGGKVLGATTNVGDTPSLEQLSGSVQVMLDAFDKGELDRIYLVSNGFVNAMTQNQKIEQLVPLAPAEEGDDLNRTYGWDYIYEPEAEQLLNGLLVRYIESMVYQGVIENVACEQSARMVAMKAATDNAGQLIKDLQLIYNKLRQAAITQEISEIVGGAAAV